MFTEDELEFDQKTILKRRSSKIQIHFCKEFFSKVTKDLGKHQKAAMDKVSTPQEANRRINNETKSKDDRKQVHKEATSSNNFTT